MVYIVSRSRGGRRCGVRLVHSGARRSGNPIEIFIARSGFQITNINAGSGVQSSGSGSQTAPFPQIMHCLVNVCFDTPIGVEKSFNAPDKFGISRIGI
jgi:hypothetical protein